MELFNVSYKHVFQKSDFCAFRYCDDRKCNRPATIAINPGFQYCEHFIFCCTSTTISTSKIELAPILVVSKQNFLTLGILEVLGKATCS